MARTKTEQANDKLMRSAGFKLGYSLGVGTVWCRGCLRIGVSSNRKMPLRELVDYIIRAAAEQARKNAKYVSVVYDPGNPMPWGARAWVQIELKP